MLTSFKKSMVIALCLLPFFGSAQENLSEVTVTTTKLPQKESTLAKSAIILSDSILRAFNHLTIPELLQQQAGITIIGATQNLGSVQSVFMRGGSSGQTLLLLDGVPLYDASATESNFDLNLINLQNIERIEILKGGQSTLYGSDAIAGVINFISKKGTEKAFLPTAKIGYGSFNTFDATVGVTGSVSGWSYGLNGNQTLSEGFSAAAKPDTIKANYDDDGFLKKNISGHLSKKINNLTLKTYGSITKYTTDSDAGGFTDDKDFTSESTNSQIGFGADYLREKLTIHLNLNSSNVDRSYTDDSTDIPATAFSKYSLSTFESKTNFVDLYSQYSFSPNVNILLGLDLRNQSIAQTFYSVSAFGANESAPINHKETKTNNFSIYSAIEISTETNLGIEIGARLNRHSVYGPNLSYSLNPFYKLNNHLTIYGIYATSFKNPSLYQLYSPYGNLDLIPEQSRNIDLGFRYQNNTSGTKANFAYFNRASENKIGYASLDSPPYGQYKNIDQQFVNGLEANIQQSVQNISFNVNYTLLNGYNNEENKEYNLLRRPKKQFNFNANWQTFDKLNVALNLQHLSARDDSFYNSSTYSSESVRLAPYTLLGLNANYNISNSLKAFVSVQNLLNKDFSEIYGFNSQPRNFRIGLTLN